MSPDRLSLVTRGEVIIELPKRKLLFLYYLVYIERIEIKVAEAKVKHLISRETSIFLHPADDKKKHKRDSS